MPKTKPSNGRGHKSKPQFIYPDPLNTVYSNTANIMASNKDVLIDFGTRQPQLTQADGIPPVLVSMRLVMSLQETKSLVEALTKLIETHEKTFGEIHLTPTKNG